jgi:hypothetical protein
MEKGYYESLFDSIPKIPSSPLGPKPSNLLARKAEAHRLSKLMYAKRPFCFLRMGDMDLAYLLAAQEGKLTEYQEDESLVSGTRPYGSPGIGLQYNERLKKAFTYGDYVDFHERLYPMEHWLPWLQLPRAKHLHHNPDWETSYLSLTWLEFEFKQYCEGRRVGIAGAEARLLEVLAKQPIWQEAANPWWPCNADIYFHQIREDGRNLDRNLDLIKEDLTQFIQNNRLDTLFIALGGGAKILCYELSREQNICTFDFGSMLRALTYSACDGNRAARSTHSPFLFRVPFGVYMTALEEAFLDLTSEELLAKAHAQLILEVQCKEIGWTHTAWEYEFSKENKSWFYQGYKIYLQRYKRLRNKSSNCQKEADRFLHFCGVQKLTLGGCSFYLLFCIKSFVRRFFSRYSF